MRLPMFPLGNVTLPGELVPLRVFEPRYRRLVLDCLAGDTAVFGIVLIERGSEVGGGDQRSSIATAAAIRTVAPLGRGQFNLVGRIRPCDGFISMSKEYVRCGLACAP